MRYTTHRPWRAAALLFAMSHGCAAHLPPAPAPSEKPPITIAVISFGGTDAKSSEAEDGCVMVLLEAGYRVVDRRRVVAAVPNENDVDFTTVGRLLGADLIVEGGWTRNSTDVPARLESRLISAHSANVLGTYETRTRVRLSHAIGRKLCRDLIAQLP